MIIATTKRTRSCRYQPIEGVVLPNADTAFEVPFADDELDVLSEKAEAAGLDIIEFIRRAALSAGNDDQVHPPKLHSRTDRGPAIHRD